VKRSYGPVWLRPLVVILLVAGLAGAHEIYIGYGQAEISGSELRGKLAYNKLDLLQALEQLHGDKLYTLQPFELEALTLRYLSAHFQAVAAEDTLRLEILGRSQKRDSVILEFRLAGAQALRALRMRNDVLFELFPQQVNTLTLTVAGAQFRYVFHPDKRVIEMSF
jgi:uncharacterized protein DUF6702